MNSTLEFNGPMLGDDGVTRFSAGERPVVTVVVVDDDPHGAVRTEDVIGVLEPRCQVRILTSGEDLVSYLEGGDLYSDRSSFPYPSLVLLDLDMPAMNGLDVLQWLTTRPEHTGVPVVVLSEWYELSLQVTKAWQLGARSFLPKPIQPHDVQGVLAVLNISI